MVDLKLSVTVMVNMKLYVHCHGKYEARCSVMVNMKLGIHCHDKLEARCSLLW